MGRGFYLKVDKGGLEMPQRLERSDLDDVNGEDGVKGGGWSDETCRAVTSRTAPVPFST